MSSNQQKIFEFVDNIVKKPLNDEVKAKKIVDFILDLDISKSYKSTTITKIKKYLIANNKFSNPNNYELIKAPRDLYNDLFEKTKFNRSKKTPKSLNQNDIDILFNLKNKDDDPWKLYIWLLFVSGRRINELFNNSITKLSINTIKLGYISKKPNEPNEPNDNIVYLSVPYDDFISVYNKFNSFKSKKPVLNNLSYYHTAISRTLNKLDLSDKSITAHSLRKSYLTYMVEVKKFRPDLLPSIRTKMLLNHDNENTSVFYNGSVKFDGVNNDTAKNVEKYNCMKITDIKKILDDSNIKYKSKMKKTELIDLIPV